MPGLPARVSISSHARQRLRDPRQHGITVRDLVEAAQTIPGQVPTATRFRGFIARSGRVFDLVAKDTPTGRLVITVIGK